MLITKYLQKIFVPRNGFASLQVSEIFVKALIGNLVKKTIVVTYKHVHICPYTFMFENIY